MAADRTTVNDLSSKYIGRKLTVVGTDWSVTGHLLSLRTESDAFQQSTASGAVVSTYYSTETFLQIGPVEFRCEGHEIVLLD